MRHGPHHAAQKSTSTGMSLPPMNGRNCACRKRRGRPEKSPALHLPHSASRASRASGTRLTAAQCGQTMWIDSFIPTSAPWRNTRLFSHSCSPTSLGTTAERIGPADPLYHHQRRSTNTSEGITGARRGERFRLFEPRCEHDRGRARERQPRRAAGYRGRTVVRDYRRRPAAEGLGRESSPPFFGRI